MKIENGVAVVTGAAGGIGRALATRLKSEGVAELVLTDKDRNGLQVVAEELGGIAIPSDIGTETGVANLIQRTEDEVGPVTLFCSNAGILNIGDEGAPESAWQSNWDIHVMAHVRAARQLVPLMKKRGGGHFLITASAAGLLTHIHSATYSVTKNACVSFAEWLSIAHGDDGIGVSVLCPQAVATSMLTDPENDVAAGDGVLTPDQVAEAAIASVRANEFLILPHATVSDYVSRKSVDPDRWVKGMRRLRQSLPIPSKG